MDITELTMKYLFSGFSTGATMLIELLKQNPWFTSIIVLAIIIKPKKHRRYYYNGHRPIFKGNYAFLTS